MIQLILLFCIIRVIRMKYTQSQMNEIRSYILKIGFTLNEKGCKVWNSKQIDRSPSFRLLLENGKKHFVNIRTFVWMEANEGKFVKDTHTSCGTFTCIETDHISPGRKKTNFPKEPYTFTESEIESFTRKIKEGIVLNDNGCHIWGGTLIHAKIPCIRYSHTRNICISRFLWTRVNNDFNAYSKLLKKTCGEDKCVNIQHIRLEDKKKELDIEHSWNLLLQKTTNIKDCMVMKKTNREGYGVTNLSGVTMASHRASYILNKNNGQPIPSVDENGNRLVVRHLCHKQPGCINPNHLELGTQISNCYEDRIDSGTIVRGEKSCKSKITESLAQEIKNSFRDIGHPDYIPKKKRAEMFGTTIKIVGSIDENRSWAHLPDRFGVVKSNEVLRIQSRKRRRIARTVSWSDKDFSDAASMIKSNITETEEGKAGTLPMGPCWAWRLATNFYGYGRTSFKGRDTKSHILSLESKYKRFEAPGEVVRHLCANPICCNPDHLCFGTRNENAIDTQLNGTSKNFKLNPDKVRLIRASKKTNAELAEEFNVHRRAIYNIRTGKTWSSIV